MTQMSPDEYIALADEIRRSPDALRAFRDEIFRSPDSLGAFQDEIRKRSVDEAIASTDRQAPFEHRRIIPSALGTDVSRFEVTARRNRYEEEQMRLVVAIALARDSNAIDVGAHGGSVLRDIVRIAPDGSHVAYEPLPFHADRLTKLFPTVDVRQTALSDKEGEATFVHVTPRSPLSGLLRRPYPADVDDGDLEEMTVRVERLDDSLRSGYVPTLIKVDVEGAEEWVLRGALETLRNHRPTVIFEHSISGSASYGTTCASLHHLLCDEAGLRIYDLAGDGPYTVSEFEESQRQLRWINYIARP